MSPIAGDVTEDAALTSTGNIIADHTTDIDTSDTHTVTAVNGAAGNVGNAVVGTYGSLTVNADGTYTYTLNNGTDGTASTVQDLAQGETHDEVFQVTVSDNHGGTATQDVTITVHGTNDAPVTQDDANHISEGATEPVTGNVITNDSDIDHGAVITVAQVAGSAGNVGHAVTGTYGSVTINTDGTYSYALDNSNAAVQALATGETLTEIFNVTATDEHGAQTPETLTITIAGTNDTPTITVGSGSDNGTALETDSAHLATGGTLTLGDVDLSNTVTTTAVVKGVTGTGNHTGVPTDTELANMFTLTNGNLTNSETSKAMTWSFNSGDKTFDYLAKGEQLQVTYTITASDGTAMTTHDVTVTITGTNDSPAITAGAESITETNATLTANGSLPLTDVDLTDTVNTSVESVTATGPTGSLDNATLLNMLHITNPTGTLSNTQTEGNINWTFSSGTDSRFDYLAAGETLTLTYTVKADDQQGITVKDYNNGGEVSTDTSTITITITGTNDVPVVSTITGNVREDDSVTPALTTSGNIITGHTTDVDLSDTHSITAVNGNTGNVGNVVHGTYGDITVNQNGEYTYSLNNTSANVQALAKSDSKIDSFTVTVSDNHGGTATQNIDITVHGSNDTPVLAALSGDSQAGARTEGNNYSDITTSGTLTVTDIDAKDIVTNIKVDHIDAPVITGGATLPSALTNAVLSKMLTFTGGDNSTTSTGDAHNITWTFNPNTSGLTGDNAASLKAFDFLGVGDTIKITYYVKATDNSGVGTTLAAPDNSDTSNLIPVTITITGTNDAPELIADVKSVAEASDSTSPTITPTYNLLTNDSDVDTPHTQLIVTKVGTTDVSSAGSDIAGKYGTLHIQSNGSYYYTLDNTNTDVNGLSHYNGGTLETLNDVFSITVSDGDGGVKSETLTVIVQGANDTPVISMQAGDSDSGSLKEFGTTLSADGNAPALTMLTGTLTLNDVDKTNTDNISVTNVSVSGTTVGLPDNYLTLLKNMFSIDNGSGSDTIITSGGTGADHNMHWTFNAGSEGFNYLAQDETLTITYTVQAKDNSGYSSTDTSNTQDVVITIHGASDSDTIYADHNVTTEDTTDGCTGNVLTGKGSPDSNADITDGHVSAITWTDSNGTHHSESVDADHYIHVIEIKDYSNGASTTIGNLTIEANGSYGFVPVKNFSGKVPTLTYHLSNNSGEITGLTNNTLDISVTPVSDTPTVTGSEVSGNENTAIALGLTLPVITDATDLNGTATDSGDSPERFGYIKLTGIPDTAVIRTSVSGETPITLITDSAGTAKIIITDKANYQLAESNLSHSGAGVNLLTVAEFESLTIQQYNNDAHTSVYAHENINSIKVTATSYEVNEYGTPISGVAGAESTAGITVGVQAVTDATPTLSMTATTLTGDEDSTFDINGDTIFTPGLTTVNDVDGSEKVTFRISGLKSGSQISYDSDGDGTAETYTAGSTGVINIPLVKNITDATVAIKDFTMKAPANFSGDITGIKFSLVTQDTDSDSSTPAEKIATAADTLTLHVNPVTDSITALNTIQAEGYEDTPISLSGKILPQTNDTDGSQKFNVKIDEIKAGSTITYDGVSYKIGSSDTSGVDVTDNGDGTFSVVIKAFDSTKLSYQAPKDENGIETLKVSAQTYDQAVVNGATVTSTVSDWTSVKDMIIQVKGVADEPSIQVPGASQLTFTEAQAEAHQVYINNLVVRSGDTSDGSEKATVKITGLSSQYSLAGDDVVYLGQSNASDATTRTWLVKLSGDPTKAYVTTPNNFSGDITLSAQAVTSENDGNSAYSAVTNVTLHVTPTPETTITLASTLTEDALSQVSFEHITTADADEKLGAVYIKASDVDRSVKIYYSDDGSSHMTFAEAITSGKEGVSSVTIGSDAYYKLESAAQTHVYAQGAPNYSADGGNTFAVKYDITDYRNADQTSSSVAPVTSQFDGNYTLSVNPVTDPTSMQELVIGNYSEPTATDNLSAAISSVGGEDSLVVTTTGSGTYQIHVTVDQPSDIHTGEPDLDGSEHLIQLVVKGVPDGVTITSSGWTYYGDDGSGSNTGMWVKTFTDTAFTSMSNTIGDDIKFTVNSGSENLWALNGKNIPISVTAVTQDIAGTLTGVETTSTSAATHYLHISYAGEGDATGWAASQITISNPTVSGTEDTGTTLSTLLNAKIDETTKDYRFSITLSGLKEGTVIGEGVNAHTVGADGKYTISGYGNNADLQALLSGTKVTLPTDYNDNNGSGTTVTATYTTYGQKGTANPSDTPASGTVNSDYTITPVTDGMTINATSATPSVDENQSSGTGAIDFSLGLNSGAIGSNADGKYETIVDGKIYIRLTDSDNNAATDPMTGTITYNGHTYMSTEVTGKSGEGVADGTYYVLDAGTKPFETSTSVSLENLAYKPADYYSGAITLTALAIAQEAGASNTVVAQDTLSLTVNPVNSDYTLTAANATGNEDGRAVLDIKSTLKNASESVDSVVISGFPATGGTSNFLVYAGADASSATLASKFYDSATGTYEWSVALDANGALPAYIAVQGLNNYSGVQNLTVTALHGENGMETATPKTFDVTFNPVADGLNSFAPDPVLVDGTHVNGQIPLNLNANMLDTDGSETASFTFKGLGDGVTIYNGSTILTPHYDTATDTYTISGIKYTDLGNLSFIRPEAGTGTVTTEGWTVDHVAGLTDSISGHSTGSFTYNITQQTPDDTNNTLYYHGATTYNGAGTNDNDTLIMMDYHSTANAANNNIDLHPGYTEAAGIHPTNYTTPTIQNVETIDLSIAGGDHTISNITAQDVLSMTSSNTTHVLTINGDTGDTVHLADLLNSDNTNTGTQDGQWLTHTAGTGADAGYDIYTGTSANGIAVTIRIEDKIAHDLINAK